MYSQNETDFSRIAEAIYFIKNNFSTQPSLDEIAKHINVSSSHFQKMFTEWAGVSPKKFTQYITISHAKKMLGNISENETPTLFETSIETGLSGTGRLHDLFINIEGMTPGEFKNGGENLIINYSFTPSIFGKIIVASTQKGICHIAFVEEEEAALKNLYASFPKANFNNLSEQIHHQVNNIFAGNFTDFDKIKLHLKGTAFQLKVWEALLKIPMGNLATYGNIAHTINNPKASRAVGSAIGDNPVAFLIPCHRVIQATGLFGQYMWGAKRKTAIIGWEAVRLNMNDKCLFNHNSKFQIPNP